MSVIPWIFFPGGAGHTTSHVQCITQHHMIPYDHHYIYLLLSLHRDLFNYIYMFKGEIWKTVEFEGFLLLFQMFTVIQNFRRMKR